MVVTITDTIAPSLSVAEGNFQLTTGDATDLVSQFVKEHSEDGVSFLAVGPTTTNLKGNSEVPISWGIGPFRVTIAFNISTLSIFIRLEVSVPIIGKIKLAEASGNLNTGVTLSFNIAVASGSLTFYLKNKKELWVRIQAKALGLSYNGDYKLFTI